MDEFFSDDCLDDLGEADLQELENAAMSFTQAAKSNNPGVANGDGSNVSYTGGHGQGQADTEYLDDDLDDTYVIDELDNQAKPQEPMGRNHPLFGLETLSRPLGPSGGPETPFGRPRYTGAEYDDPPPHGKPAFRPNPSRQFPPGSQYVRPASSIQRNQPGPQIIPDHPQRPLEQIQVGDIVNVLQNRVRALEQNLTSAKGEASILRNKHEAAQKSHEADIARLKKQHTEQLSRQERAVEAAVAAQKSASTELLFAKQDLREELDKGRKGRKDTSDSPLRRTSATPRRNERWAADGFDDAEIMPSPSRGSGRRTKDALSVAPVIGDRTPKGKRKRGAMDSPLELEDRTVASRKSPRSGSLAAPSPAPAIRDVYPLDMKFASRKLDLTDIVLNHSSYKGGPTTFDCFAGYALPSKPGVSFSATLFRGWPHMGTVEDPMQVYVDFCMLICDLWTGCVTEKYYEPISDLLALLTFLLQMYTTQVAPKIVSHIVPPALETICIVTFEAFESKNAESNTTGIISDLHPHIPTIKTMSLLYLVALACSTAPTSHSDNAPSPISQFWRIINLDFALSALSPKQHPSHFFGALTLLRTSALPGSIGPITSQPDRDPDFVARHLLDRISFTLESPPKWASSDSARLVGTKLEVIATLSALTRTQFGRTKLAENANVIPRLVNALSGAIDALYDVELSDDFDHLSHDDVFRPEGMSDRDFAALKAEAEADEASIIATLGEDESPDPLPHLYELIRETVKLLHLLITDESASAAVNVSAKLSGFSGAYQRYLLTMGRLNFSEENQILERGVDEETQVRAHELLELVVLPDESEGVEGVFG